MNPEPNRYPRVTAAFFGQPWALLPEKFQEIAAFIRAKAEGSELWRPSPWANRESRINPARPLVNGPQRGDEIDAAIRGRYSQVVGKTGFMELSGVLGQKLDMMTEISGGTSTQRFGQEFDSLMADKTVSRILIAIDSPGGSVFGTSELADKIFKARDSKRIVAVADSMAASAAYWIGSQASEFLVTPGGQVGSIGVVAAHHDMSKAEEAAGVKTTLISAGQYKTEGDPSQPLSAEGGEQIQKVVNQYYAMFLDAVARGRGVSASRVRSDFGQGRMLTAQDAKAAGMVDGVATVEKVLSRLNGTPASAAMARARALEIE